MGSPDEAVAILLYVVRSTHLLPRRQLAQHSNVNHLSSTTRLVGIVTGGLIEGESNRRSRGLYSFSSTCMLNRGNTYTSQLLVSCGRRVDESNSDPEIKSDGCGDWRDMESVDMASMKKLFCPRAV